MIRHRPTLVLLAVLLCSNHATRARAAESERVEAFDVRQVTLLEGPFLRAQQLDAAWLLSLDCDRLLSWFRKEAGLEPKGEVYGGWENRGIAGHSLGHYLTACSRMYVATGREEFLRRVNYIVEELAACQQAGGDGYVGAIPDGRKIFAQVASGDIRSQGFDLNGSWVPWYNLHKLYAGLIDAAIYCENEQAKEVVSKLADWAIVITKDLTPEQWQDMLACEFGGMNESLADLYALTGEDKYLQLAKKFYHSAILDPLAAERDELDGKHANTQIPKIIGAARIAELGGEEKYGRLSRFFWQTMVDNHTYVTGGNSMGEHLGTPGKLNSRLGDSTTETCNTYNMLKLTSKLFAEDPDARFTDYAERSLWNHILASENPNNGRVCYFVPLAANSTKPFMDPEAFTCCSGSGMENPVRYADYIYARAGDTLYVNQFFSSELDWEEQGITLRQLSEFPLEGRTRLRIETSAPKPLTLKVRHPFWATQGFQISVNGEQFSFESEPGSYVTMEREWADGDLIDVVMPTPLRTEAMPDNPGRVACFYGPILLAGVLDTEDEGPTPVLVTDNRPVDEWLVRSDSVGALEFATQGVGRPKDFPLEPFFSIVDDNYIVYWDIFSESQWEAKQAEYEAELERQRQLAARTVDLFAIGEMQPERDHNVQGEKTGPGEFGGRKLRHAWDGGWFSFDIDLPEGGPADLIVTYWGSETGRRTFDVLVNDQKLATQALHRDDPDKFWDRVYQLPESETAGKQKATIKFQAHPGNYAGGVFGVRVVRREAAGDAQ